MTLLPVSAFAGNVSETEQYVAFIGDRTITTEAENFRPNETLNRAMFASFVIRALGEDTSELAAPEADPFDDVSKDNTHAPAIKRAADLGIIGGYGDGTFGPRDEVTRQQMALMVIRALGDEYLEMAENAESAFDDTSAASYAGHIAIAAELGILGGYGDGNFGPTADATRGQAAKIVSLFFVNDTLNKAETAEEITAAKALLEVLPAGGEATKIAARADEKAAELEYIKGGNNLSNHVRGESFVLKGLEPKNFAYVNITQGSITVTSRHADGTNTQYDTPSVTFQEGVDYVIDYENATIARLTGSSIPDWADKPTVTLDDYTEPTQNNEYLIWAEYYWEGAPYQAAKNTQLPRLLDRIKNGSELNVLVVGDSIAGGAEVEKFYDHFYIKVWIKEIESLFKNIVTTTYTSTAVGGSTSGTLYAEPGAVLVGTPDVVFIGYGMNDQRWHTPSSYEAHIRNGIDYAKTNMPGADIILIAGALGNYETFYSADNKLWFDEYATRLELIANELENVAFVNVTARWAKYLERKTFHDLLRNDINHPTSFGSSVIYAEEVMSLVPLAMGIIKNAKLVINCLGVIKDCTPYRNVNGEIVGNKTIINS